jgi:hypothetical protein
VWLPARHRTQPVDTQPVDTVEPADAEVAPALR